MDHSCCFLGKKMKLKKRMQNGAIVMLEKRYSGVRDVVNLLDRIRDNVETQQIKGLVGDDQVDKGLVGGQLDPDVGGDSVDGDWLVKVECDNNGEEKQIEWKKEKHENENIETPPAEKDIVKVEAVSVNAARTEDRHVKGIEDNVKSDEEGNDKGNCSIFKPDDGKWRPVVLTLGLVYKLQKVTDDSWYDAESVFMQDLEKVTTLVELLAYYWWYLMGVAKNIGESKEESMYENLASGLKVEQDDILFSFVKDAERAMVSEHCPDFSLVVHHDRKEMVLTVCGTKMFPAPSAADIMMDLYAESVPFHQGRAHRGMVAATENILTKVMDTMAERLVELPNYKLVVLGYSLGAGVAQLLTIRLTDGEEGKRIPDVNQVLCITFGSPPVYVSQDPAYVNKSIISVYNHNDGLASLSLHTVTKLFLQIRAINRLCLARRKTLKLLRSQLGEARREGGTSIRRFVRSVGAANEEEWNHVTTAVEAVTETGFARLTHCAGFTYLIKTGTWDGSGNMVPHVVRTFAGEKAQHLAQELRLRAGMFNDHMPWGYAKLFKDCGGNSNGLSLDLLRYI